MEKLLEYREETAGISFPGIRMDRNNARKNILRHAEKHPGTIKIAESGGKPVGYIMFQPRKSSFGSYGHADTIFVEKAYRSQGVGALLLKSAEKWFRKKGIKRMNATITASNRTSLDFFREHGYRQTRVVVEKKS
jgi:GNAT superfamily N-acetyltransferase